MMDQGSELPPGVAARVDALEAQLRATPAAKALYLQLAQLYADNGRKALAIEALQRCLKVDPGNALVQHRLNLLTHAGTATSSATAGLHKPAARFVPRAVPSRRRVPLWAWVAGGAALLAAGVAVKVLLFPDARLVVADSFDASGARWSPQGDRIAFLSGESDSARLAVHDLREGTTETFEHRASEIAWAPDGMRIAYTGVGTGDDDGVPTLHVIDLGSKRSAPLVAGSSPVWSPDGRSVALVCHGTPGEYEYGGEDASPTMIRAGTPPGLCVVDAADGRVRSRPGALAAALAFAPERPLLVYEAWLDEEPLSLPSSGGEPAPSGRDEFEQLTDAALAGQSRNAYEGSRDLNRALEAQQYDRRKNGVPPGSTGQFFGTDVFVVGADGSSHLRLTEGGRAGAPRWTADGRVLFAQDGTAGTQIMTVNPDGSGLAPLFAAPVTVPNAETAALTRDGRRLVYVAPVALANEGLARVMSGESASDLYVVDVAGGKPRRLENRHPFKQRFALAPDGRRIAYEFRNGASGKGEIWIMSF